jgi:hypothetical protein
MTQRRNHLIRRHAGKTIDVRSVSRNGDRRSEWRREWEGVALTVGTRRSWPVVQSPDRRREERRTDRELGGEAASGNRRREE